ncbi:hypothetical protein SAMN04487948_10831 [Halogranum amylolyticum]|uniref:Uncharacterized protein n=1 Tax=Halogranum amylolyticum TaxID=660520 RepID=A0A1H8TPU6_9EURY|nr:hypothetical protein [Halogranum amylolyticum]SEO92897.1 hypothetical protein SAMN04487948_10831 [Halogranum amylolyticum]
MSRRPPSSTAAAGLVLLAALLHTVAAGVLWTWFGFDTGVAGDEPFFAYVAVGAVLLGALPAVAVATRRLRAPALVVAAAFTLSAYGTWSIVDSGLTPVDPTPFGWYLLGWPLVAVAALLVGGGEYGLRRYRRSPTAQVRVDDTDIDR